MQKHSLQNSFRQIYLFEISRKRNTFFSFFKKGKAKNERFQFYLTDIRNLTLLQTIWTLKKVKEGKGLLGNFIWWSKLINVFSTKLKEQPHVRNLRKRTIMLHGNKLAERIHVDKFSKYLIKGIQRLFKKLNNEIRRSSTSL